MLPSAFVHMSAHKHIIMLVLLIFYHGPYTFLARRGESERNIKQMDHQTIPEQRAVSLRTLKHISLCSNTCLHVV